MLSGLPMYGPPSAVCRVSWLGACAVRGVDGEEFIMLRVLERAT